MRLDLFSRSRLSVRNAPRERQAASGLQGCTHDRFDRSRRDTTPVVWLFQNEIPGDMLIPLVAALVGALASPAPHEPRVFCRLFRGLAVTRSIHIKRAYVKPCLDEIRRHRSAHIA